MQTAPDAPILADPSDLLFYAALALLPVDGTVAGIPLPFWTPLSPWFFLAYALVNWRAWRIVARRYLPFVLFPLLLILTSLYGWTTIGMHGWAAARSLGSVILALACLASLETALRIKKLPWRPMVGVLVSVYWAAFAVGVVQWAAIHLNITGIQMFFERLMYREYIAKASPWGGPRPQFLFAEPSYIGMHLFGVLLPVYWMVRERDRSLACKTAWLIIVFAAGAVLLGAGVRIILDSLVVLGIVTVESTSWRVGRGKVMGTVKLLGIIGVAAGAIVLNQRMDSILHAGWNGDGSFSARIWQSLGPLMGIVRHPLRMLIGYGAGNLAQATHDGARNALSILDSMGMFLARPQAWYSSVNANTIFTMSAYTSFVVEFGAVGFVVLLVFIVCRMRSRHVGIKTLILWFILLLYLYAQFEGYAFYALPLYIWGCCHTRKSSFSIVAYNNIFHKVQPC